MPRWNCSPLQRFATYIDLQSINDPKRPEFGPLIWKKKSFGGVKRNTRPVPMGHLERLLDGSNRKSRKITLDDWLSFYKPVQPYPTFFLDGYTHNAVRWLFFQMYDDSYLYPTDPMENEAFPEDEATRRRLAANEEAARWMPHEVPGKYRPYSLYHNQRYLIVCLLVLNPHTGKPREDNEFYYHYRLIDGVKADPGINYFPDLCGVKYQDWRENVKRVSSKTIDRNRPLTGKRGMEPFKKIELVYPQVRGKDRLAMVRHYLRGGTDADNPYLFDEEW